MDDLCADVLGLLGEFVGAVLNLPLDLLEVGVLAAALVGESRPLSGNLVSIGILLLRNVDECEFEWCPGNDASASWEKILPDDVFDD